MRANFVMSGVTDGLRRNLLMTIALVLTTAVSLSFVAGAILTGIEIHRFENNYKEKLYVSVYLCQTPTGGTSDTANCKTAVSSSELDALRSQFSTDPSVSSFDYIDENEAYQIGQRTLPAAEVKFLRVGDLPSSFSVKLKNIKSQYSAFATKYQKAPGVNAVQSQDASLKTILDLFNGALLAAIIAAAVVLLSAIILIAITIQVAAAQRRNETSIMRLVGASRWMTQLPFLIEAVIGAAFGGVLAIVTVWAGKHYLLNVLLKTSVDNRVIPDLTTNDLLLAGGASLLAGILLAAITAYATLRLYVRL